MVELAVAGFLGFLSLPLWVIGIFVVAFLVDIGCSSRESFTAGTVAIILAVLLVSGLGWWMEGPNPIAYAYNNPVDVLLGFLTYVLIGCLWCIAKWWLFLGKVKKEAEKEHAERLKRDPQARKTRPRRSYASNNASRLTGWIFHWPFSVLGVVVGDIIIRFADTCYKMLRGLFERMARARFSDYDEA